jgi:hypothetical protein
MPNVENPEWLDEEEVLAIKNALTEYIAKNPSDKNEAAKLLRLFSMQPMYFFNSDERFAGFAPNLRKALTNALNDYKSQKNADLTTVICLLAELENSSGT